MLNIEHLRLYLLAKRGCTEDTPFGEDLLTFRVLGKIFACIDLTRPDRVVLKTTPARSGELYARYSAIFGAWHWNKQHWLEAIFGGDASDAFILKLADEAYAAVLHGLPKKRQIAFFQEGLPTDVHFLHANTCTSTNDLALSLCDTDFDGEKCDFALIHSDLQRRGRGQQGTCWESQNGKNLTFSFVVTPDFLPPAQSFRLLQAAAVAIVRALGPLLADCSAPIAIKWPNDIYFGDSKLCGTLIQNVVSGDVLRHSIVGIGLNVNQLDFSENLPNPVSLAQILGVEINRFLLLERIVSEFRQIYFTLRDSIFNNRLNLFELVENEYLANLYRRVGTYAWRDAGGQFRAAIDTVLPDGTLRLRLSAGTVRAYAFKEVEFVI